MEGDQRMYLVLYVDDIIIADNCPALRKSFKKELCRRYSMKDLGELRWCLGMRVRQDLQAGTVVLDQEKYVENVLKRFGFAECRPVSTPAVAGHRLTKEMCPATDEEKAAMAGKPYASLFGSLMYAMVGTRPDIAFIVGCAGRYLSNPGDAHWDALKRVLRYLRGTKHLGIVFCRDAAPVLVGYSDADWSGDVDSSRSTTGYVFTVAGGAVSWNSRLQRSVALSSAEAEFMALCAAAQEMMYLKQLMEELLNCSQGPVVIYEDNQGCLAMAVRPAFHSRTRHIRMRFHFVRELIETNECVLEYCPTGEMAADILTKALPFAAFEKHRIALSMRE
jgi:hypothetical protein